MNGLTAAALGAGLAGGIAIGWVLHGQKAKAEWNKLLAEIETSLGADANYCKAKLADVAKWIRARI